MSQRPGDPYSGFSFLVDFGGGDPDLPQAGFREVTGLSATIDVIEYRVGNDKTNAVRKLPGLRKFSNVTLKRGITQDLSLWQWFDSLQPERRNVTITLLDAEFTPVLRFRLANAWPVRWSGPELDSQSSEIVIESVELVHERLDLQAG